MTIEARVIRLERRRPASDLERMTDEELLAELRAIDPDAAERTTRILSGDRTEEEFAAWRDELRVLDLK